VFRGLLLDLDDTLFDRGIAFDTWCDGIAQAQLGRVLQASEREALHAFDRGGHRSRCYFADDARQLGLVVDPARFPLELASQVTPEVGVVEVISELARTRRVAIVTNGGAAQRAKLERIGLDKIVRTVLVSEELGIAKPDARIFQRALAWSELRPEEILFVGDEPVIDLAPAASLGMATAWRARPLRSWPRELAPPTYKLTSIEQLREIA
jgi:putative hydrolase of the HAD superfamily